MRCASSTPASAIEAFSKDLKPIMDAHRSLDRPVALLDDVVEVFTGANPSAASRSSTRAAIQPSAVEVVLSDGARGFGASPSDASTGSPEALELRDRDPRHYLAKASPRR
jgi:hypothetical protein